MPTDFERFDLDSATGEDGGSGFMGMAFTASYIQALEPAQQEAFRSEVRDLLAQHGHEADEPFTIPYRIDCWIARRSAA